MSSAFVEARSFPSIVPSGASLAESLSFRLLKECGLDSSEFLGELALLQAILEADPAHSIAEMSYFRNRLGSSARYALIRERGAAAYQLREIARRLRRV
jgi:hypothetical protein